MKILVINCGSSSLKYKFYQMPSEKLIIKGSVDKIGERGSGVVSYRQGLRYILEKINGVEAIGHRVVHGGQLFNRPRLITEGVIRKIKDCSNLAPLHNPVNLVGILSCRKFLRGIKQVAVFDTAFHQTMPAEAFIYGLPYNFYQKYKIRKYGFHGTSHEYVASEAAKRLNKDLSQINLITCHLGNGCSITAIKKGRSIDTSMGFTPLEGLVMGTRCGDLDPAVVIYLIQKRISPDELDNILNKESGLKGISGLSNDMSRLQEAKARGSKRAALAIKVFTYRIQKYISAYLGILGRTDAIVFTAGIGQNHPAIIRDVCKDLFGNLKAHPKIMIIPTDEELMIARQTYGVIMGKG